MAGAEGADTSGESKTIAALRHLSLEDLPSLEILLLDDLVTWAGSADNPGQGYGEDHGGLVISAAQVPDQVAGEHADQPATPLALRHNRILTIQTYPRNKYILLFLRREFHPTQPLAPAKRFDNVQQ